MLQVFCLEYLDHDEGHETGHFIDWPLEAERTGYLSDGYAVMDCLFSTQLFDSQLMADDGQDKLEEGHIIMPSRWSYVDSFRYDDASGATSSVAYDNLQPPRTQ